MTRKTKRLAEVEKQLTEEKEGSQNVSTQAGSPQNKPAKELFESLQDTSVPSKKSSQNGTSHFLLARPKTNGSASGKGGDYE